MNTTIGILGSGAVGQTLAKGFIKHGYDVMIGTNNASKHEALRSAVGAKARIGTFAETASYGKIIVLAVKGSGAIAALRSAGIPSLAGKTILDATNPIADAPPVNGVLKFTTTLDSSLMEDLQQLAPEARFVKAFSCVGNALMVDPVLSGGKPTMFICGNDAAAKRTATEILLQFGWDVEDMGAAEAARAIEPLCMLWCIPGFLKNDWVHAFRMLRP